MFNVFRGQHKLPWLRLWIVPDLSEQLRLGGAVLEAALRTNFASPQEWFDSGVRRLLGLGPDEATTWLKGLPYQVSQAGTEDAATASACDLPRPQ